MHSEMREIDSRYERGLRDYENLMVKKDAILD
jgi:hypothetical protein